MSVQMGNTMSVIDRGYSAIRAEFRLDEGQLVIRVPLVAAAVADLRWRVRHEAGERLTAALTAARQTQERQTVAAAQVADARLSLAHAQERVDEAMAVVAAAEATLSQIRDPDAYRAYRNSELLRVNLELSHVQRVLEMTRRLEPEALAKLEQATIGVRPDEPNAVRQQLADEWATVATGLLRQLLEDHAEQLTAAVKARLISEAVAALTTQAAA